MAISKMAPVKAASLAREVKALELRKSGYTFTEIGKALVCNDHPDGISRQAATKLVARAFKKLNAESVAEAAQLRVLEMARLDTLYKALEKGIERREVPAIVAALKISERRTKLAGIEAATQVEIKSTIQSSVVPDQAKRMAEAILGKDD